MDLSTVVDLFRSCRQVMNGTTRSRINDFMNKFRKLDLIEYNGDLKVHSSLLNVIVRE